MIIYVALSIISGVESATIETDHFYIETSALPYNGDDAFANGNQYCQDTYGTKLATVCAQSLQQELLAYTNTNPPGLYAFWIGLYLDSNGVWKWTQDDTTLGSYNNWDTAHFRNPQSGNMCIFWYPGNPGSRHPDWNGWMDWSCGENTHQIICNKNAALTCNGGDTVYVASPVNPTYSGVYRTHPYATPYAHAQQWCQDKYGTDLATIRNMNDQHAARTGCTAWKCIVSLEFDANTGKWFNPEGTSFENGYTPEFIAGQGHGSVGKYAYIYGPLKLSDKFEEIGPNVPGYPLCNHPDHVPAAKSVNYQNELYESFKPIPNSTYIEVTPTMIIIGGLLIVNLICLVILINMNCNKKNKQYAKVRNYVTSDDDQ